MPVRITRVYTRMGDTGETALVDVRQIMQDALEFYAAPRRALVAGVARPRW